MLQDHYERIRTALSAVSLMQVSRDTGIAYNTLRAVRSGTANPQWSTMQAIEEAIMAMPSRGPCFGCDHCIGFAGRDAICGITGSRHDPHGCVLWDKEDSE